MLSRDTQTNLIAFIVIVLLTNLAAIAFEEKLLFGAVVFSSLTGLFFLITLSAGAARFWVMTLALYVGASVIPNYF